MVADAIPVVSAAVNSGGWRLRRYGTLLRRAGMLNVIRIRALHGGLGALAQVGSRPGLEASVTAPCPLRIARLHWRDGSEQHGRTDQHHGEDVPGSW